MRLQTLSRIYGTIIILIIIWAFVHRLLVFTYHVNPWKLYGFAMYTTSHYVDVALWEDAGETRRTIMPEELSENGQKKLHRELELITTLGEIHSSDHLAKMLFAEKPRMQQLTIDRYYMDFMPFTARYEETRKSDAYDRSNAPLQSP